MVSFWLVAAAGLRSITYFKESGQVVGDDVSAVCVDDADVACAGVLLVVTGAAAVAAGLGCSDFFVISIIFGFATTGDEFEAGSKYAYHRVSC